MERMKSDIKLPKPERVGAATFIETIGVLIIVASILALALATNAAETLGLATLSALVVLPAVILGLFIACILIGFAKLVQTNSDTAHYIQYMAKNQ